MIFPAVMNGCESWIKRRLSVKEVMLSNCGPGEDSWDFFGMEKDQSNQNPKGNQPWRLNGRTDAEVEAPILWLPDVKNWLIGKDPDAGEAREGTTEDKMVGWHHQLNGHEFEQALGVGDGQGSLGCCSPCVRKESDTTEWLNWTDLSISFWESWVPLAGSSSWDPLSLICFYYFVFRGINIHSLDK